MRTKDGIYKSMLWIVLIMFSGLFVLTACNTSATSHIDAAKPFVVDTGDGDQGLVLRLLSSDGKGKIEIFDDKFSDGTNILESVVFEREFNTWKQRTLGQAPYKPGDQMRVCGGGQFGILEIVDPNIISVDYETKKEKIELSIIEVNSRRFITHIKIPANTEYYQIYGINKDGNIIWQLFTEGYWKK